MILPPPELRELARIMNRRGGLPDAEIGDRGAAEMLLRRGLVTCMGRIWSANDDGARAYVATLCVEAGSVDPFASSAGHPDQS